jgi:hypothetical protein
MDRSEEEQQPAALHQHRPLRTTPHPDEPSSDLEERLFDSNNDEDEFDDERNHHHHHRVVHITGSGSSRQQQQQQQQQQFRVSFRRESSDGLSSLGSPGTTRSKRGSTDSLQCSAAVTAAAEGESTVVPATPPPPSGAARAVSEHRVALAG